ncbi:MAG: hypothetical protein OHK0035_17280 [Cyanobacteria bacterium J069]
MGGADEELRLSEENGRNLEVLRGGSEDDLSHGKTQAQNFTQNRYDYDIVVTVLNH